MIGHSAASAVVLAIVATTLAAGGSSGIPSTHGAGFHTDMQSAMTTMDRAMMSAPTSSDPDRDFLAMMVPHHQGAIDMAKAVLRDGHDPIVRRLAEEIVATQQAEIAVMVQREGQLETPRHPAGDVHAAGSHPAEHSGPSPSTSRATSTPRTDDSHDRVYTADQTSNTVSVIDPHSNTLLGVIRLGDPVPGALTAVYRGQLLVHGLGFSPDHHTLAVISVGSNSVTLIDTESNAILGHVYLGRAPHEGFFTPNGRELWVTVRGESYVSVIDPARLKEVRRIPTANGPAMVLFRPDGRYAFIPSSFTPEMDVVDTRTYAVVARIPQKSPFSPNLAVSRDGSEVWVTLKDSGKTQVISARPPFRELATLETGPITNHVTLVDRPDGEFAYITVGGEDAVKVYRRGAHPTLVDSIATGALPHGIWGSGDGSRVYVGLENQDSVAVVDTYSNRIVATIPVGQQPQALVYVPDAVPHGDGTAGLAPLGDAGNADHLLLQAPPGHPESHARATVSVNSLGPLDLLQVAASGLKPGTTYELKITNSGADPSKSGEALATFKANASGAQVTQVLGPFRRVLTEKDDASRNHDDARFLAVTESGSDVVALIQIEKPARLR